MDVRWNDVDLNEKLYFWVQQRLKEKEFTSVSEQFKKDFCEKWLCFNRLRENIEKYERETSEEKAPNSLLYLPAA